MAAAPGGTIDRPAGLRGHAQEDVRNPAIERPAAAGIARNARSPDESGLLLLRFLSFGRQRLREEGTDRNRCARKVIGTGIARCYGVETDVLPP